MNISKQMSSFLKKSEPKSDVDSNSVSQADDASNASELSVSEVLIRALDVIKDTGFAIFNPDQSVMHISASYKNIIGISESLEDCKGYNCVFKAIAPYMDDHTRPTIEQISELTEQARVQMPKSKPAGTVTNAIMANGRTLRFRDQFTDTGHHVSYVSDVTNEEERNTLLNRGMLIGTSGYWAFNFETGQSDFSDYIASVLSDEELERARKNGLLSLVHKDDLDSAGVAFLECKSNRSRMDGQFRIVTQNRGVLWVRIIGEFIFTDDTDVPTRFVAFINDVTTDVRNQEELDDAQELSRAKSEFLARMSHEIKTPLNAIVGMTDALLDEVQNDEARETARYIADAAQSLDNVLSQTLEHARLSSKELVLDIYNNNPKDIVRSTAALFKKSCSDKGLKLNLRVTPSVPDLIQTDPTRLRQCLTNLLSNAIKFTEQGQIDVVLATAERANGNTQLVFAVKDTGIGMSANASKNIFKPFAQADETISRRFGGSGLGMAITSQIVEAMSGNIRVKSELGTGTTVLISVPLILPQIDETAVTAPSLACNAAMPSAAPAALGSRPSPSLPVPPAPPAKEVISAHVSQKVTINPSLYSGFDVLVVEDNPINQKVVGKLLAGHVRSVTYAFHGEEALKILGGQSFDVILMDIHMPIKDGIETTLEIRNSGEPWADVVIVALTADPDYQQRRICRNIGMNDTISKPVRRQDLLDAMQRVLSERKTLEQAVA